MAVRLGCREWPRRRRGGRWVAGYLIRVMGEDGCVLKIYELGRCEDPEQAITICHALMSKHDHLQLWNGPELVHTATRAAGGSLAASRLN